MNEEAFGAVTVCLLADRPELIDEVGRLRWREWGHPPEPEDESWWIEATRRESGDHGVPVTFIAVNSSSTVVGAVALGEFDLDERRDRSPWVMGMVVRPECRDRGVGRMLMDRLESHAAESGYRQVWVATQRAAGFYQRCGWRSTERIRTASGESYAILRRTVQAD